MQISLPKETARFNIPKHGVCAEQLARSSLCLQPCVEPHPQAGVAEPRAGAVPCGPRAAARLLAQAEVAGTGCLAVLALTGPQTPQYNRLLGLTALMGTSSFAAFKNKLLKCRCTGVTDSRCHGWPRSEPCQIPQSCFPKARRISRRLLFH